MSGDSAEIQAAKQDLTLKEKAFGQGHPDVGTALNRIGMLYLVMGQVAEAEAFLHRALAMYEMIAPEHPRTASLLGNLASFYQFIGDNAKVEPLLERALKIREKAWGPEHPNTANNLGQLAGYYMKIEDYAKAEVLYQRALRIHEKTFGPERPNTALALKQLAQLYQRTEDYAKAETLLLRALKINENALGLEHRNTGGTLDSLASLYWAMGDHAKAEPLFQRALNIQENALGPEHRDVATRLVGLAWRYHVGGYFIEAEPLYKRTLTIQDKLDGSETPTAAFILRRLALLNLDLGMRIDAIDLANQVQLVQLKILANILSFTSEQQRLAYQERESVGTYDLLATVGGDPETALAILRHKGVVLDSLLEDRLIAEGSRNSEQRVFLDKLRSAKQRLARLLLETPKDFSPEAKERHEAAKRKLVTEVEQLEVALARYVTSLGRARRALSVTVEQVQKDIPRQTVLLELLRYSHYLGTNKFESRYGAIVLASTGEPKWVSLGSAEGIEKNIAHYQNAVRGAVMQLPGPSESRAAAEPTPAPLPGGDRRSGAPTSQAPLSGSRVTQLPARASSPPGRGRGGFDAAPRLNTDQSFSTLLQALYHQLWSPIEAALPKGTKTVILSPDGALNFLSFATLLTPDDQFLSQKYSIRYVSSGRDLLKEKKPLRKGHVMIFGNPDFAGQRLAATRSSDAASTALPRNPAENSTPHPNPLLGRGGEGEESGLQATTASTPQGPTLRFLDRRDLQDFQLSPLPGTAKESATLAAQAKRWDWPASVFLDAQATEVQLQAVQSPRILHLATHGFFLPDVGEDGKMGGRDGRGVRGIKPYAELTAPFYTVTWHFISTTRRAPLGLWKFRACSAINMCPSGTAAA